MDIFRKYKTSLSKLNHQCMHKHVLLLSFLTLFSFFLLNLLPIFEANRKCFKSDNLKHVILNFEFFLDPSLKPHYRLLFFFHTTNVSSFFLQMSKKRMSKKYIRRYEWCPINKFCFRLFNIDHNSFVIHAVLRIFKVKRKLELNLVACHH